MTFSEENFFVVLYVREAKLVATSIIWRRLGRDKGKLPLALAHGPIVQRFRILDFQSSDGGSIPPRVTLGVRFVLQEY